MRIQIEIEEEASRLIRRHETKARLLQEDFVRREKRSISTHARPSLDCPSYWALDDGFNPYLARARAARIAHSIRGSLRDRTYTPRRPVELLIPKASEVGTRPINIYQVADGAISKMLFEVVLKKNLPTLSARAYAYRKDVSAQDAIQYVKSSLVGARRMFIAEYDFTSYFESIDHEHIRRTLNDRFLMTEVERSAIDGFLRASASPRSPYSATGGPDRETGIPQGTSVSLLLANVAAWDLDRALETAGVGFTRYADDTLIWSKDYSRICQAAEIVHSHAEAIGVAVNSDKSPGIRLLAEDLEHSEMSATTSTSYLGYELSLTGASIKPTGVQKIKSRTQDLIYWTLLYEPLRGTQNPSRITPHLDQDYVSLIWRLRRYLYGDLSERAVRRYQRGDAPLRRFKGVMAAYPLIDDAESLASLDGWIASQVHLALRRRASLLAASGIGALPIPHGLDLPDLLRLQTVSATTGQPIDLRIPSVRRVARAITKAATLHGAGAVGKADPYGY